MLASISSTRSALNQSCSGLPGSGGSGAEQMARRGRRQHSRWSNARRVCHLSLAAVQLSQTWWKQTKSYQSPDSTFKFRNNCKRLRPGLLKRIQLCEPLNNRWVQVKNRLSREGVWRQCLGRGEKNGRVRPDSDSARPRPKGRMMDRNLRGPENAKSTAGRGASSLMTANHCRETRRSKPERKETL